jgi:hypothetical protein
VKLFEDLVATIRAGLPTCALCISEISVVHPGSSYCRAHLHLQERHCGHRSDALQFIQIGREYLVLRPQILAWRIHQFVQRLQTCRPDSE